MEEMKSFIFAVVVLFVALVAINQVTALPHLRNVRRGKIFISYSNSTLTFNTFHNTVKLLYRIPKYKKSVYNGYI